MGLPELAKRGEQNQCIRRPPCRYIAEFFFAFALRVE
jgi:hypothetical protein